VENFGWNFFAMNYSEPAATVLSSAAMVTAAEKVQSGIARAENSKKKCEKKTLADELERRLTRKSVHTVFRS
jgi:hypothetical protein